MKRVLLSTGAALAFGVAVAAGSFAQQPQQTQNGAPPQGEFGKRGGHHGGHGMNADFLNDLNLTDAQRTQVQAIQAKYADATKAQREELRLLKKQQKQGATLTAEQQARAETLQTQVRASERQERQEIFALLTPEQKATLKAKMQERKAQRMNGGAPNATTPPSK